ncbi:MAG: efflux RND transporter periplasmic adaptor subunit [Acidobacteriota bacterium]|nr:MAG: efflux RND transporter periplasmic adaptor subunit [Acidobacteriota bacterium]
MQGNSRFILAFAGAVLLSACGGSGSETQVARERATPVNAPVSEVAEGRVAEILDVTGTVQSVSVTTLGSKAMGHVRAIHADAGDSVRKGQVLVEIDDRDIRAQVTQAEAGLAEARAAHEEVTRAIRAGESGLTAARANQALAESTFQRFEQLLERRSVSQQEFDEVKARQEGAQAEVLRAEAMLSSTEARKSQVEAKIAQAEAQIESSRIYLGYTRIEAPFAGVVTRKMVEVGQLAAPGVPLLTIENSRKYRLEADLDESLTGWVFSGQKVPVSIDALGTEVEGTVVEVLPTADPVSRKFTVRINLPEEQGIRTGMFGRARLSGPERSCVTIPESSIFSRGQLLGVFVLDSENIAQFRLVKTGREQDVQVEILSGVQVGDLIVLDPSGVRDGVPVNRTAQVQS